MKQIIFEIDAKWKSPNSHGLKKILYWELVGTEFDNEAFQSNFKELRKIVFHLIELFRCGIYSTKIKATHRIGETGANGWLINSEVFGHSIKLTLTPIDFYQRI